jgi:hypothetical protein
MTGKFFKGRARHSVPSVEFRNNDLELEEFADDSRSPGEFDHGELGPDGEEILAGMRAFQEEELAALEADALRAEISSRMALLAVRGFIRSADLPELPRRVRKRLERVRADESGRAALAQILLGLVQLLAARDPYSVETALDELEDVLRPEEADE